MVFLAVFMLSIICKKHSSISSSQNYWNQKSYLVFTTTSMNFTRSKYQVWKIWVAVVSAPLVAMSMYKWLNWLTLLDLIDLRLMHIICLIKKCLGRIFKHENWLKTMAGIFYQWIVEWPPIHPLTATCYHCYCQLYVRFNSCCEVLLLQIPKWRSPCFPDWRETLIIWFRISAWQDCWYRTTNTLYI